MLAGPDACPYLSQSEQRVAQASRREKARIMGKGPSGING